MVLRIQRVVSCLFLGLATLAGTGCSDISATNPYDPKAPPELRVKGQVSGSVLRETYGSRRLPAAGATVALIEGETELGQVTTDTTGHYVLPDVPLGTHLLRITLERHQARRVAATVLDRDASVVDEVVLAPERGRLSGRARFPAGGGQGAALLLEGAPGDALLAELGRLAIALAPDGAIDVEGLPAGPYVARVTAPGHRSSSPVDVVVQPDVVTAFDATLSPWRHALDVAEATNASVLSVALLHDPELDRARIWVAAPGDPVAAPDGLEYSPSDGVSPVEVSVPDEGQVEIRAQVANSAALDADETNDIEAYVSPVLRAILVVDRTPPRVLSARHVPEAGATPGYAPRAEATLEVEAVDDGPGSRIVSIAIGPPDAGPDPATTRPFAPRFTHTLPEEGLNPIAIVVADAAGNRSAPASLESGAGIVLDTSSPVPARADVPALAPLASPRSRDAVAQVVLSVVEPDASPAYLQLHDASVLPTPFEALPIPLPARLTLPVALSPGEDGPRQIVGRVRDAAGNELVLPELTLTLDRLTRPVTAIRFRAPGGEILNDGAGAINVGQVDVELEVAGADEAETLSVPELGVVCELTPPASTCVVPDVALPAPDGAVTVLQLTALAVDGAGNSATPYSRTITADRERPGTPSLAFPEAVRRAGRPEITNGQDLLVVTDAVGAVRAELHLGECDTPPAGPVEQIASLPGLAHLHLPADGTHTVVSRIFDAAANEVCVSRTVELDTGAPQPARAGEPALSIAETDRFTGTSAFVTLSVVDPEDNQLLVGLRDTSLPAPDLVPLPAVGPERLTVPVTLSPGPDGPRTVSGVVRDVAGNELVLPELTLRIDTHARPVTAIRLLGPDGLPLNGGAGVVPTADLDVELEVEGADEPASLRLPDLGVSCRITPPATRCVVPGVHLDARPGTETIVPLVAVAEDDAGNVDIPFLRTVVVDLEAPGPAQLVFLDVTRRAEATDVTNDPALQVEVDANGAVSARVARGRCGQDGRIAAQGAIAALDAVPGVALLRLEGDGETTVAADFLDAAGNTTCVERPIRLDTAAPTIGVRLGIYNANGALTPLQPGQTRVATRTLGVLLELAAGGDPDCAVDHCALLQRVSLSPTFEGRAYEPFRPVVQLELPPVNQRHVVYAQLVDPAGNVSEVAAEAVDLRAVELDQQGPAVPGMRRHFIAPHKIRLEIVAPADRDLSYYQVERLLPELPADAGGGWQTVALAPAIADDDSSPPRSVSAGCLLQHARCSDASNCIAGGPKTLLVEDRNVQPGRRHLYRVRAYDDLGNASGDSIPVDGGVPALPPSFVLSLEGDDRQLSIQRGLGATTLDRVSYDALGVDGEPSLTMDFPAGRGTVALPDPPIVPPPAPGAAKATRPLERVEVETSNPDRSIVWESAIDTLGMTLRVIEPGRPAKTGLAAVVGRDGYIHVVHPEKRDNRGTVLAYDILDPALEVVARHEFLVVPDDDALDPAGMSTFPRIAAAESPTNGHVYAATRLDRTGGVRLVDLTASIPTPDRPVVHPGPAITCTSPLDQEGCLRRTHLGLAFDAAGLAHVGVSNTVAGDQPNTERHTLGQAAFRPGQNPPALEEVARDIDSQGLAIVTSARGPVVVYITRSGSQLVFDLPNGTLPVALVPRAPGVGDDWVFAQNTLSAVVHGDRLDVAAVVNSTLWAATLDLSTIQGSLQELGNGYRAPSVERTSTGQLQIVASVQREGRDDLVLFRPADPQSVGLDPTPRVIATVADTGPNYLRGAFGALLIDALGVPVYVFKSEDAAVTALGLDFLVEDATARPSSRATPALTPDFQVCSDSCPTAGDTECDDGGPDALFDVCALGTDCSDCGVRLKRGPLHELHGAVDERGSVALAYLVFDQLLVSRRSGDTTLLSPRLLPQPDDPRSVSAITGVARGADPADGTPVTWVSAILGTRFDPYDRGIVYVSGVRDDRRVLGPYALTFRNALGAETLDYAVLDDAGATMALSVDDAGAPRLTLREPARLECVGDRLTCAEFAPELLSYHLVGGEMRRDAEVQLTAGGIAFWNPRASDVVTPDGRRLSVTSGQLSLQVVDVASGQVLVDRPQPRYGMTLQAAALDASGRVMVAMGQSGRLMFGPADGDWEDVTRTFDETVDVAELVTEPDGVTRLTWTETGPRAPADAADGRGDREMAVRMREMRPNYPSNTVRLYSRVVADRRRNGLVTRRASNGEVVVYVNDPSADLIEEVRVRPSRPLAATHTRIDPTPRLGLPGDADADGHADADDLCPDVFSPDAQQAMCAACPEAFADADADGVGDAGDNCPDLFNPDQTDANHNGRGDACEGGAAECLSLPVLAPAGLQRALADDGLGLRPQCLANAPAAMVFRFTAPGEGSYTFSTEGSNFDTVLDVRSDCVADRGQSLNCQDDTPGLGLQSAVTVPLAVGQSVYVIVASFDPPTGQDRVVLTVTGP